MLSYMICSEIYSHIRQTDKRKDMTKLIDTSHDHENIPEINNILKQQLYRTLN
jgi:hypothetical protein